MTAEFVDVSKPPAPTPMLRGDPIDWPGAAFRTAASAVLVGGYYWVRESLRLWILAAYGRMTGDALDPTTPNVIGATILLVALVLVWRNIVLRDPRFHAPLLATTILLLGDAAFHILESQPAPPWLVTLSGGAVLEYSPSALAVLTTIIAELILGRFFYGKWPHLASAYISGISVGILIKSSLLWPFVLCGLISIASKYVLRIGARHLWNPTNFGVTMMLMLAPLYVASLSVQAGNNGWAVAAIWLLGGLIMVRLGRFHIPLAFVLTWAPLAIVRSSITGHPWQAEIAPITSPMFQLYIFFMITDPKTTTKQRWSQTAVAMLVAVVESALRLAFKDVHSLYHALFIVGPTTNLLEILILRRQRKTPAAPFPQAPVLTHSATPSAD